MHTSGNKSAIMPTYNRLPIDFERGEGSYLFDTEGNKYLDAISGLAVCALGHSHPAFTRAISEQAGKLIHTSNLYGVPLQDLLAEKLCQASGMESTFFCNSGAESNEAAIKIARMYGYNRNIAVPTIIVMEGAFHGRTMGALSATHNAKHVTGFAPLLEGFIRVPYNDVNAVIKVAEANSNVVAILVEPLQGEAGICTTDENYLNELRAVCDKHDMLLMLDEVQTGNGRTGKYFAFQHSNILPDVLTTAKGLGNGFPMGACLARGKAASVFQPGHHATTFGGSPLACAAGLAVNKALIDEGLLENAHTLGLKVLEGLQEALQNCEHVVEIRGQGMLIGVELSMPCGELLERARNLGILINIAAGNVVRLLPPLTLKEAEADTIIEIVSKIISEFNPGDS